MSFYNFIYATAPDKIDGYLVFSKIGYDAFLMDQWTVTNRLTLKGIKVPIMPEDNIIWSVHRHYTRTEQEIIDMLNSFNFKWESFETIEELLKSHFVDIL